MYLNHMTDSKIFKGIAWKGSMTRNYSSSNRVNHYDVLNLKNNCSDKEIRESFVKLSKEHHPDTNASTKDGSQFTKIMEAYKVLGKTESRKAYDHSLKFNCVEHDGQIFRPYQHGFYDPQAGSQKTYGNYDPRGRKRFSNKYVVYFCVAFAGIGMIAQFIAIRHSVTFKRKELARKSAEISALNKALKAEAEKYDKKEQLERLMTKIGMTD